MPPAPFRLLFASVSNSFKTMNTREITMLHAEWIKTYEIPPGIDLDSRRIREAGPGESAGVGLPQLPPFRREDGLQQRDEGLVRHSHASINNRRTRPSTLKSLPAKGKSLPMAAGLASAGSRTTTSACLRP